MPFFETARHATMPTSREDKQSLTLIARRALYGLIMEHIGHRIGDPFITQGVFLNSAMVGPLGHLGSEVLQGLGSTNW